MEEARKIISPSLWNINYYLVTREVIFVYNMFKGCHG